MSPDAMVYIAAALVGALVGGLASVVVSVHEARGQQRVQYGLALLEALGAAHDALVDAAERSSEPPTPSVLPPHSRQANLVWLRAELVATLERRRADRQAIQLWAGRLLDEVFPSTMPEGHAQQAEHQLDAAVYLAVAWTSKQARGRDFLLTADEVSDRYGPRSDQY